MIVWVSVPSAVADCRNLKSSYCLSLLFLRIIRFVLVLTCAIYLLLVYTHADH